MKLHHRIELLEASITDLETLKFLNEKKLCLECGGVLLERTVCWIGNNRSASYECHVCKKLYRFHYIKTKLHISPTPISYYRLIEVEQ